MNLAFRDLYGVENGFQGVEFAGRTDRAILLDGLELHRLPTADFEVRVGEFEETYLRHLRTTLAEASGGRVLPGVRELLTALESTPGTRLGLATGNFRRGAFMKLEHYQLHHFFPEGGFGGDSEDRSEVVAAAIRRLNSAEPLAPKCVCVVGDTPIDVEAARANGARAVGVATGRSSTTELSAAGADLVFADFADWKSALDALLSLGD